MSEAQKYQGALYRGEKKKGKGPQPKQEQALVPHKPTFDDASAGAIAVVDVPPKAPSPPPASDGLPPGVNVFDFLVKDNSSKQAALPAPNVENGYAYGAGPVEPSFERYDSYNALPGINDTTPLVTPGPKREREERKSEKKRKRESMELDTARAKQDHDMSDAPQFHTGLTGGLNRMLSGPDFSGNEAETPLNPDKKRSKKEKSDKNDEKRKASSSTTKTSSSRRRENEDDKERDESHRRRKHRHRRDSSSSEDDNRGSRKHVKAIEYRGVSAEPRSDNQVVSYRSPAELFMSFVNKGPDSERGLSINKALKRYHSEQRVRGEKEDDKDLWKGLRLRKNERGEVVLFM